jgi:hypothetical protein
VEYDRKLNSHVAFLRDEQKGNTNSILEEKNESNLDEDQLIDDSGFEF